MKKIAAIIFGLTSLGLGAQSINNTGIQEKSCDVIKNSPAINSYVDDLMEIEKFIPDYGVKFTFDSNSMLANWVEKRVDSLPKKEKDRFEIESTRWVNKCAFELKDTKYLWLFAGIEYNRLNFKNRSTLQKYLNYLTADKPAKKTLDANGNIIEIAAERKNEVWVIQPFSSRSWDINKHAAVYALYLGGGAAVENIGKEVIRQTSSELGLVKEWSAKVKKEKEELGLLERGSVDRVERIRKGDFKLARNCIEIHDATKAEENLKAYVTPNNKMKSSLAKLISFTEDRASGRGRAIISDGDDVAEVKMAKETLWFNRQAIKLNSNVIVVGWYKENVNLPLVNGSTIQSPLIEAVCVQPE